MRRDDQIVIFDQQIAHGGGRQVVLKRTPVRAIIERGPHAMLGGGIQQAGLHRIGAHCVHRASSGRPALMEVPGFAAVVSAIDVWMQIVDPHAIYSHVGRVVIEARRVDLRDLAPGVTAGGVIFVQFAPPSLVIQTKPSSVPAQIVCVLL